MLRLHTEGIANKAIEFTQAEQLKDRVLWKKFVDVFRSHPDAKTGGWCGEFWGKMMRGGSLVYEYSQDCELYDILTESVKDMLTTAEDDGRVSTYDRQNEFISWDLWCRKYVILGLEYYLDICKDEALKAEIITFICRCADYIILHIGDGEGQTRINDATGAWLGLNSSSILEPIVKLYRLTKNKKYLDFATYIVNEGGARRINIFKHALENKIYPYQYGISKAYEMTSCFEGLLEYYYATGTEWCKSAVINFVNALIETEISVIGGTGITHELLDFTRARQTVRQEEVLQETCVTVTWIKMCARMLELTKNSKYADCMEQSFYNAYLGAFNTDHSAFPELKNNPDIVYTLLPFDSYSPLLSGRRGVRIGGCQHLPDHSYYGCCNCIAAAGVGIFMKNMITVDDFGITINFFENGTAELQYEDSNITITQKTAYPTDGKIEISIKSDRLKEFELRIRIPGWTGKKNGYAIYEKEWLNDTITLHFDMPIRTQLPMKWEKEVVYTNGNNVNLDGYYMTAETVYHNPDDDNYIALMRGPLTLAVDSRSGKAASSVFDFEPKGELCSDNEIAVGVPCLLKMRFTDKNGEDFYLVDYASAGKDWKTEIAAWLRTK